MDTVQEDTGRHHLYRAHTDCAAAVAARHRILLAQLLDAQRNGGGPRPGRHTAEFYNLFGWIPAAELIAREDGE